LREGKNERAGKPPIFVGMQKNAVNEPTGSPRWLAARNAVFSIAEMAGRKALAESIKTSIRSDRESIARQFGADDAPPSVKAAAEQLSIADKGLVLADKALDAKIKQFDPRWKGSNGDQDSKQKIVTLQAVLQQNVESSTELFAQGAFTAIQCEGPSTEDGGKYAVLVGLIWSPTLQKVAEAIWNPSVDLERVAPKTPLADQLAEVAESNPSWMAYTLGARVYTNEHGERVVVGFGVAPRSSLMSADKDRARLSAQSAIQKFVAEKFVASGSLQDQFEQRDYSDGTVAAFDSSKFESRTKAVSAEVQLRGATEIGSWRGEHPWSKAGMQVVAIAWTPTWDADSRKIDEMMSSAEKRMQGQGGVPAVPASTSKPSTIGGSAVPARSGARSTTFDF
jgi:hypothetical protein